jgi:hypothetical protein
MTRRIHLGEGVSYSLFAMCVSFVSISRSFWLRLSCRTEVRELRCSETLFTFAFLVLDLPLHQFDGHALHHLHWIHYLEEEYHLLPSLSRAVR